MLTIHAAAIMPSAYDDETQVALMRLRRVIRDVSPCSGFPVHEDSLLGEDCGIVQARHLEELKEAIAEEFELEVELAPEHSVDELLQLIVAL